MIRAALDAISLWAIPVLLVAIPLVGIIRKVKVYDVFIEGAKEGFEVAAAYHPRSAGDPAIAWLRQMLRESADAGK